MYVYLLFVSELNSCWPYCVSGNDLPVMIRNLFPNPEAWVVSSFNRPSPKIILGVFVKLNFISFDLKTPKLNFLSVSSKKLLKGRCPQKLTTRVS